MFHNRDWGGSTRIDDIPDSANMYYPGEIFTGWSVLTFGSQAIQAEERTQESNQRYYSSFFSIPYGSSLIATYSTLGTIDIFKYSFYFGWSEERFLKEYIPSFSIQDLLTGIESTLLPVSFDGGNLTNEVSTVINNALNTLYTEFNSNTLPAQVDKMFQTEKFGKLIQIRQLKTKAFREGWSTSTNLQNAIAEIYYSDAFSTALKYEGTISQTINEELSRILEQLLTYKENFAKLQEAYNRERLEMRNKLITLRFDALEKILKESDMLFRYNESLLTLYIQSVMSLFGGTLMERGQTKGERLLSSLTQSASLGIQAGLSTKNPQIGLLAGMLNLGASLWSVEFFNR